MKKHRFYIKSQKEQVPSVGILLLLSREDSHHLRHVLRIGKGDSIYLFDGDGRDMEAVVESFTPEGVKVRITRILISPGTQPQLLNAPSSNPEKGFLHDRDIPGICVELALPFLKSDKLETVFRMASQLGSSAFHLFLSKRCIPHPGDAGLAGKMKRWERIILDSIRISGRSIIPGLQSYDTFENFLKAVYENRKIIFAYEQPGLPLLSDVLSKMPFEMFQEDSLYCHRGKKRNNVRLKAFGRILLVTGPEGGFTPEEADLAARYGAETCSLGESILKAETAPVAALAVILSFLGRI